MADFRSKGVRRQGWVNLAEGKADCGRQGPRCRLSEKHQVPTCAPLPHAKALFGVHGDVVGEDYHSAVPIAQAPDTGQSAWHEPGHGLKSGAVRCDVVGGVGVGEGLKPRWFGSHREHRYLPTVAQSAIDSEHGLDDCLHESTLNVGGHGSAVVNAESEPLLSRSELAGRLELAGGKLHRLALQA